MTLVFQNHIVQSRYKIKIIINMLLNTIIILLFALAIRPPPLPLHLFFCVKYTGTCLIELWTIFHVSKKHFKSKDNLPQNCEISLNQHKSKLPSNSLPQPLRPSPSCTSPRLKQIGRVTQVQSNLD